MGAHPLIQIDSTLKTAIPLVSVVIPTHNRSELLKRAVQSVLSQTWQDFEIIVVSDGSIDNTQETVASFQDDRIRFLHHPVSKGASAARNTGMKAAKSQYIAFLDDDDEWTPDKLELQMPVIINSEPRVGLVYAWMEYFDKDKSIGIHAPLRRGYVLPDMLDKQAIGGCPTVIIKKEVLNVVGGFDEELMRGNDGDFFRRVSKYFEVDYVPLVLARIHVNHGDRISMNSRKHLLHEVFTMKKRIDVFNTEFQQYPRQKSNVFAQIAASYILICEWNKAYHFFKKAMQCKISLLYKAKLIVLMNKRVFLITLNKLRHIS
ncbi:MAG: glycosyltransferase family 2 protein [Desulfobacteraceae bacterium]|nr:MAG: glycosyltransferase family 2 protein [Desulfobacteraceae bacterium]